MESEVTFELRPQARLDFINVSEHLCRNFRNLLSRHKRLLYYSYHTTAGYLDPGVCEELNHRSDSMQDFVRSVQELFPPGAKYQHDQLHLRTELTEEERKEEPKNADAHLTFIGSGLSNCVTYPSDPRIPVYFIDLDGIYEGNQRLRHTTVIGFNQEEVVAEKEVFVSMSNHAIDSVNLRDDRSELMTLLRREIGRYKITKGRIEIQLLDDEQNAGLTVNEFETMLMKHDLLEVLRNPFRFMAESGKHMVSNPRAIPRKAKGYAKYDFVHLLNEFIDVAGLTDSVLAKLIHTFMALPASHYLKMKRSVNLLVSRQEGEDANFVHGKYQSPILVQWSRSPASERCLRVTIHRFS